MKIKFLGLVIAALVVMSSCKKKSDKCYEVKPTAAFVFEYPDTVQVNELFSINVNYVIDNSCGSNIEFVAKTYDNTLEVELKTIYEGCNCDDEFEEKTSSYPIIFDEPGVYELKFWIAENEYESYTIVAEE